MTPKRKLRILCFHSFRTSGKIFRKQMEKAEWLPKIESFADLLFIDAPNAATGKSDVEGYFDPPYFEWYTSSNDYLTYYKWEETISFISDFMIIHGPFDGMLGFSQGGILTAAFAAMQSKGMLLHNFPQVQFSIIVGSGLPRALHLQPLFENEIEMLSLHFIGEKDFFREYGEALLKKFKLAKVIRHPKSHVVPKLDNQEMESFVSFLTERQNEIS